MEAYPGYRCPRCGGHSNMMGTGHWSKGTSFVCEKAPTRGLLEPLHYDSGPELSVDYDKKAQRFERHYHSTDGRFATEVINEVRAFDLVVAHFPKLLTPAKESLRARLVVKEPEAPEPRPRHFRPSALAEAS